MNNKFSVAIIGSGPAGLACAQQLFSNKFNVTVFDELSEFGGMLAYGIPQFRIPLSNVHERINQLKGEGINFESKKIVSLSSLLKKFDFVVLAVGYGIKGTKAGFIGENNSCVIDAQEFLLSSKLMNKNLVSFGENVAVIGGGNSAMDAARVAKRIGANVTVLYRRTENEMPALKSEISGARADGVNFDFLKSPKEFTSSNKLVCSEMVLSDVDESGRRKAIDSGRTKEYYFDKILVAVGQQPDFEWLEKQGVKVSDGAISVNNSYETSLPKVFACGDCIYGPKTIGDAVKSGILCAKEIIAL